MNIDWLPPSYWPRYIRQSLRALAFRLRYLGRKPPEPVWLCRHVEPREALRPDDLLRQQPGGDPNGRDAACKGR